MRATKITAINSVQEVLQKVWIEENTDGQKARASGGKKLESE